MKLKSRLVKEYRETSTSEREAIAQRLADLGWSYLIDEGAARPSRKNASGHSAPRGTPGARGARTSRESPRRAPDPVVQQARERQSILRELESFGSELCEICSHWAERHQMRDGRLVCLDCEERGDDYQVLAVHAPRTLYDEARRFFGVVS